MASLVETYSGTSSRWGQRWVVAQAVQRTWRIISLDIGSAFLKGLTFDEVAQLQGTERRTIHFDLPPGGAAVLRD